MPNLLRRPSRILNENSVMFGLNFSDLIALAILLICLQLCLKPFGLEFFALVGAGVALVILSSIRMTFRRKIVRDTVSYFLRPKAIFTPIKRDGVKQHRSNSEVAVRVERPRRDVRHLGEPAELATP